MSALGVMRYLLVAPDNSSQLPIDIPDEIVVKKQSKVSLTNKSTRKRQVQKSFKKPKTQKRKQSAKSLSK